MPSLLTGEVLLLDMVIGPNDECKYPLSMTRLLACELPRRKSSWLISSGSWRKLVTVWTHSQQEKS
jgi:hypothetical protein